MKADELRSRIKEYCKQHYISHTHCFLFFAVNTFPFNEKR